MPTVTLYWSPTFKTGRKFNLDHLDLPNVRMEYVPRKGEVIAITIYERVEDGAPDEWEAMAHVEEFRVDEVESFCDGPHSEFIITLRLKLMGSFSEETEENIVDCLLHKYNWIKDPEKNQPQTSA